MARSKATLQSVITCPNGGAGNEKSLQAYARQFLYECTTHFDLLKWEGQ